MSTLKSTLSPGTFIRCGLLVLMALVSACGIPAATAHDLVLLPNILLATNVAAAGSDASDPGQPGVGFDGTNYLVVTSRSSGSPAGLLGVILSAKGAVLRKFTIGGQVGQFPDPALAFDGTNYLLVFNRQGQIYGLRISAGGQVLDANDGFPISTGIPFQVTNYRPGIAFDGQNFLVVWQKYQDPNFAIYGARVTPGGEVLGEFLVFAGALWQTFPEVAFDGANYLVVWEHKHGVWPNQDLDIYATRVSPAGAVLDPAGIPICTATNDQQTPHLTFDGRNYLVLWLDNRNYSPGSYETDIMATRVTTNGVVLDGPASTGGIAVNTLPVESKNDPRVCFDGHDFFVVWWLASYSAAAGSYAARISSDGVLLDGPPESQGIQLRAPDPYCKVAHPTPVSNGRSVLVSWINNAEIAGTYKDALANLVVTKPRITRLQVGNPGPVDITLTFMTRLGVPYQMQSSSNLSTWQSLGDPVTGTGESLEVVLPGEAGALRRFYCVRADY